MELTIFFYLKTAFSSFNITITDKKGDSNVACEMVDRADARVQGLLVRWGGEVLGRVA